MVYVEFLPYFEWTRRSRSLIRGTAKAHAQWCGCCFCTGAEAAALGPDQGYRGPACMVCGASTAATAGRGGDWCYLLPVEPEKLWETVQLPVLISSVYQF